MQNASRPRATPSCYVVLCYVVWCGVSVGACESGIKPTATITAADTADQVMANMSHYVTAAGIQRAHVRADTAYFYSPLQTAELRSVHITFYDPRGAETSTLTAREGTYHWGAVTWRHAATWSWCAPTVPRCAPKSCATAR